MPEGLETAIKWAEQQEGIPQSKILLLQSLGNEAVQKRLKKLK